jgi:carbonic anhydrase
MAVIDQLIENNARYAAAFQLGALPIPPRYPVALVTCMDARLLPSRFFGLEEGDAHVIRNAGGSAREALRSLIISQRLLGTREVAVVKHTDCGMLTFANEDLRENVIQELGADAGADAGAIDFLPFSSLEDAVRDDVRFLRSSALIAKDVLVRGFIYDLGSGQVREVE